MFPSSPYSWIRGSGVARASSGSEIVVRISYSTSIKSSASKAVSSSRAMTAATGSPTCRTRSTHRACSSWLTGRIPYCIGTSFPVSTKYTPGCAAARDVSIFRMRACGCGDRSSLQCAMRGKKMSSANRVWPVTFARASTLRRGTPITRSSLLSALRASTGVVRESFSFAMRPPQQVFAPTLRHLRSSILLLRDLEHRGFDGFENLQIARAAAQVSGDRFADLIAAGARVLIQQGLRGHQNRRRAIAALRRSKIGKSILQGMQVSIFSEALHGQYLLATTLERQHQAGQHGLAVQ